MSYDLLVFSKEAAPKTRIEFIAWYEAQTAWKEEQIYSDPAITTPELRAWLIEMVKTFPDVNGPDATDNHTSDYETDYSIGRVVIYAAFSWALVREAHDTAHRLAQKYQVGFYDPNFEGAIPFPEIGDIKPAEEVDQRNMSPKKPWWKLW